MVSEIWASDMYSLEETEYVYERAETFCTI